MAEIGKSPSYTVKEEVLNTLSHGIGALLAIVGTAIAIVLSVLYGTVWTVISSCVYGTTLILLYTMSTLYHAVSNQRVKKVMQVLDHSTIFLLIAGTYTPYTLVTLQHRGIGFVVFFLVWGCAVLGIILNAVNLEKFKKFCMFLYILSGWAAVIAIKPIIENLGSGGLILMLLGGLFYTGGIFFYCKKKYRYFHAIWHLFVLAGSILHYFSILFYVIVV